MTVPDQESFHPAHPSPLFPHTAWSRVARAGHDDRQSAPALEDLCLLYREPARKYLVMLGCRHEEAEDLTQEFLQRWATRESMQRLDPGMGRMRSYIRQSLRNLLANHRRDAAAQRRGGGVTAVELEEAEIPCTSEAESELDTGWSLALLRTVIDQLRTQYAARGKEPVFDALATSLFDPDQVQPYAEIGVSLGMQPAQIKLEVHRLRRRFGEALRATVAATVADPAEVDDEMRHVLRAATQAAHA